jgi:hypothetical protein
VREDAGLEAGDETDALTGEGKRATDPAVRQGQMIESATAAAAPHVSQLPSLDSARGLAVAERGTSSCAGRMWVVSTYIPHEEDAP